MGKKNKGNGDNSDTQAILGFAAAAAADAAWLRGYFYGFASGGALAALIAVLVLSLGGTDPLVHRKTHDTIGDDLHVEIQKTAGPTNEEGAKKENLNTDPKKFIENIQIKKEDDPLDLDMLLKDNQNLVRMNITSIKIPKLNTNRTRCKQLTS